jgi:hypothetical protein
MIDLHKVSIGSTILYQGKECVVLMLRKYYELNLPKPGIKEAKWIISLTDKGSYQEDYFNIDITPGRLRTYTGEIEWESIRHDCIISNAIDFIREPI